MPEDWDLYAGFPTAVGPYGVQITGILRTHGPELCRDDPNCCLHNPSKHPLDHAPMNWRVDRGLMERICEHGVGHPDPDDLAHKRRSLMKTTSEVYGYTESEVDSVIRDFATHGCDGCCRDKED